MAKGSSQEPMSTPPAPQVPQGTPDDAFTAKVLEVSVWARRNTQLVIGGVAGVVVVALGVWYAVNQRSANLIEASTQLEQVQQAAAMSPTDEAVAELERYLARFGKTPYGMEARLVLGELLLEAGRTSEALAALSAVAPGFGDPLQIQATYLLAAAYEQAEDWDGAIRIYRDLSSRAEMNFQRREATEGLARAHLAKGDIPAAISAYEALIAEFEEGEPIRNYFEMRLQEIQSL
jgi:predicted negative regulator of RcsB-dependent stress response